jgi:cysteine dioxygenase
MIAAAKLVSIQRLVDGLRQLPDSSFGPTEPLRRFLQETPVDADSLGPYLNWDRQHYTRNLIDRTPLYELMTICWEVGQASSVHNHRDQNCWMAVPIGRLLVENFHLVHEDLQGGRCRLEPTNTVEMNIAQPCAVDPADPVHRVVNSREFNQRAVSLHVYSRPFDTCVVYSPEQGTCGEIQLHFNTEFGQATPGKPKPGKTAGH